MSRQIHKYRIHEEQRLTIESKCANQFFRRLEHLP